MYFFSRDKKINVSCISVSLLSFSRFKVDTSLELRSFKRMNQTLYCYKMECHSHGS